jgi:hypothetical protein
LVNLQHLRILDVSGASTRPCPPKWLNQASVKTDFVRLDDVGMRGNGHEMFFEKNSDDIIRFIENWIQQNVK